jgi:hypothetical protein
MATRYVLTPYSAEFPATNFPQLLLVNRRPALAFDAATAETCYWTGVAPVGLTGTITAIVQYIMASATSGKVDFTGAFEAVTDGDSTDLDAGTSIDTANAITAPTVPGTAGYIDQFTITMTNADSIAAGDYFRFVLVRDATDGTNDTASGDCYVLTVEIRDAA